MSTIAVGDIHGNLAALDELLTRLEPELRPTDELVFLGDYIDDGPDVAGCIARILECRTRVSARVVGLMGNHEQWMLGSRHDHTRHSWLLGMTGLKTIASYSPEAAEAIGNEITAAGKALFLDVVALSYDLFFDALPREHMEFFLGLQAFHRTADLLCVHGGYADTVDLSDEASAPTLIWGPPRFPDEYDSDQPVVYGHHNNAVLDRDGWPHPNITRGVAFGIDTIRHGVLTAMRFPDRRVFQSRRFDGPPSR